MEVKLTFILLRPGEEQRRERQERRRGIFEQQKASMLEVIGETLRLKTQLTAQILTSVWM